MIARQTKHVPGSGNMVVDNQDRSEPRRSVFSNRCLCEYCFETEIEEDAIACAQCLIALKELDEKAS